MTTERRYTCNLCGDRIVDTAAGRGDKEGTGVLCTSYDGPFRFVACVESERHICGGCIAGIRKESSDIQSER